MDEIAYNARYHPLMRAHWDAQYILDNIARELEQGPGKLDKFAQNRTNCPF
jgi:hypothetical protein